MQPPECQAIIEAWENKRKRERIRDASLHHIIAVANGMKKQGGGKLSLYDFAPDLKELQTPQEKEAELKARFQMLAANSKRKT